jgi:hypothetical protein
METVVRPSFMEVFGKAYRVTKTKNETRHRKAKKTKKAANKRVVQSAEA